MIAQDRYRRTKSLSTSGLNARPWPGVSGAVIMPFAMVGRLTKTSSNSPICSGGPASVTGIGIQKAGKIFMGALNRKTSTWRYANVRSASLAAVVELYGAASTECATTKAAWNAVSERMSP